MVRAAANPGHPAAEQLAPGSGFPVAHRLVRLAGIGVDPRAKHVPVRGGIADTKTAHIRLICPLPLTAN